MWTIFVQTSLKDNNDIIFNSLEKMVHKATFQDLRKIDNTYKKIITRALDEQKSNLFTVF